MEEYSTCGLVLDGRDGDVNEIKHFWKFFIGEGAIKLE